MAETLPGLVQMQELQYSTCSSVLIYGPAGIGKTTAAFSLEPRKGRFVLDFEAGLKVVRDKKASVFRVSNYQQLWQAIMWLQKDEDHDIVIADTLTEMARVIMLGALQMPTNRPVAELPVLQDWTLTIERVRTVVRKLRELIYKGKYVIFTAAASVDKDQNTGKVIGGPELPGKQLSPEVCYLMDEVYRMDAQGTPTGIKRALYTAPDSIWVSKSRIPGLPAVIEAKLNDPTLNFLRKETANG